ncbi:MAG TPA: fused MFS/spermidine synthase [Rhizomicrobium sp.]|nr:fused MFS/spermidine synthase [Rhizomicrobium sp.]
MIPVVEHKTRHGEVVVLMSRTKIAYWQDDRHQSEADRNGISLAAYIHAIHGFLRQAKCRTVLMIGCGGGNLATMLRLDGVRVTVAEINERSFAISRRYFHMPDDVECHLADGAAFLRRTRRKFDAIVVDAYDGDEIPAQLRTPSFFRLVKTRLTPRRGCFFVNVVMCNDRDRHLDRIGAAMSKAWSGVRLLDAPRTVDRNAVAMAGAVAGFGLPKITIKPKCGQRLLAKEVKAMRYRKPRSDRGAVGSGRSSHRGRSP